jgi:hypothetical protein
VKTATCTDSWAWLVDSFEVVPGATIKRCVKGVGGNLLVNNQ